VLSAEPNSLGGGYLYGLASFVIFVMVSLLAIEPIRRRYYELFYYPHFLVFIGIGLAMVHSYVCFCPFFPNFVRKKILLKSRA
jgi:hypothetical protein